MALPVLAMALQAKSQHDEATKVLADSDASFDRWMELFDPISGSRLTVPWFDIVECGILRREAAERISGTLPPLDERLLHCEVEARGLLYK